MGRRRDTMRKPPEKPARKFKSVGDRKAAGARPGKPKTLEDAGYKWIKASRDDEAGRVALTYQITEPDSPQGSDSIEDDNLADWTDQDVKETACLNLGIDKALAPLIEMED